MRVAASHPEPTSVVFAVLDGLSLTPLAGAIDVLRLANQIGERHSYRWTVATADGAPAVASGGLEIKPDAAADALPTPDIALLCAGLGASRMDAPRLARWMRRLASHGVTIGGIDTAPHLLARWGLLDGHTCTLHWNDLAGFLEAHPDLTATGDLFEIDRQRITCAGGAAAIDLMLNLVRQQHGGELAGRIADQLMHERIRDAQDRQHAPLAARLGVQNTRLIQAIELMENNLEEPLSRPDLALATGLSCRQLERLFQRHLGRSPARYYLELRLDRARRLLSQTDLSVLDVALACGFASASHFSKCFRDRFARTPRCDRWTAAPSQTHAPADALAA